MNMNYQMIIDSLGSDDNFEPSISLEFKDATLKAKAIGQTIRSRVGKDWIPEERMWMIYDPCMTTEWRDADTAARFQEFLSKRRAYEKAAARVRRHASADRRRELVSSRGSDEKGEVITQVVNLFVDGLLEELKVANTQGEKD